MEQLLEFFKITGPWAAGILGTWIILNIVGELVEKTGKIVPEFMKVRKFLARKKEEKKYKYSEKAMSDLKTSFQLIQKMLLSSHQQGH